ncbi:cell division protein ZapD [Natronocella acetinitrilica]|uniref:Cell division protein ZapD n=1 Tax=Natronocella acetinitrilica TaxID=414046 RepID=A0AAE3G4S7_9GAMM|nr:cell division protein ZapD [Natronocella acetinitrilica]MCP1673842.1 cell division protein ZapD [Natronocella acetinitrilica]
MDGVQGRTIIAFEQPLNERMRILMRLEHLFQQSRFAIDGDSEWHSRLALGTLVEILDILTRGDVKSELMKELDRVGQMLHRLEEKPGVDTDRLHHYINECDRLLDRLREHKGQLGASLRQDELLSALSQRSGIAGGTCAFDLPGYHYWLHLPAQSRRQALEDWFGVLRAVQEATDLILQLVRESATPRSQVARDGVYQRNLDRNTPYQMVRVELPEGSPWFAEISGSKHFVTIRFLEQPSTADRAAQISTDVEFSLRCCML